MADGRVIFEIEGDTSKIDKSLDDVQKKSEGFGSGLGSSLKVAGKAFAALGAAAVAADTAIIKSYAEMEQLVGGAQLLFGGAYDFVAEKAAGAYATVQMSQAEYLQQVNGFAVGLKTALGDNEQAAAELADRILTAEADIVAATGASQDAVQNAFNGIMKSNYTMLDNLQLGITPTKEGFQELIDKVNEWNATEGRATNYQIDNLADAQSALVDYIAMQGLAGYAADEAAETISGSAASVKAAWQNMVSGLGDANADVGALVQNLMDSLSNLVDNVAPIVSTISQSLIDNAKPISEAAVELIFALGEGLLRAAPNLLLAVIQLVADFIDALTARIQDIHAVGVAWMDNVIAGIGDKLAALKEKTAELVQQTIKGLQERIKDFRQAAQDWVSNIRDGITQKVSDVLTAVRDFVRQALDALKAKITDFRNIGKDLFQGLINGIKDKISSAITAVKDAVGDVINAAKSKLGIASPSKVFKVIGQYVDEGLAEGISDTEVRVTGAMDSVLRDLISSVGAPNLTYMAAGGSGQISNSSFTIAKLADSIIVRETADIDAISDALYRRVNAAKRTRGVM